MFELNGADSFSLTKIIIKDYFVLGLNILRAEFIKDEFVELIIRLLWGGLPSSQTVGSLLRTPWAQCYKTFYIRNLRIFVIS